MTNKTSQKRLSTGNEFVSIPDISTRTGGIETVGFLHSGFRACIELHGSDELPLLAPVVEVDGRSIFESGTQSELQSHWIPRFTASSEHLTATSRVFAPLDRRGFVCVLTVTNTSDAPVIANLGWRGCWESSECTTNSSKQMAGVKHAFVHGSGVPVIEFRGHIPLFAMAIASQDSMPVKITGGGSDSPQWTGEGVCVSAESPVWWETVSEVTIAPGEVKTMPVYAGIGLEEVSAVASALDLRLHGRERLLTVLGSWLAKHTIKCSDKELAPLMNVNSFYNYFYSQGIAIDSEELIVTSARSSRNGSCAAYGDRDAMRWSLPAVLQIDSALARRMLLYAFTTQLSNVGVHSRFSSGIVLEPGMQLDQLCAPIRALYIYISQTEDMSILFDRRVQVGINTIQQILAAQRHSEIKLFETLLLPSGSPSEYPYVCFSNVLVWRILLDLAWLYDRIRDIDRVDEAKSLARSVREAILRNFVVRGPFGDMYARGVDLKGGFELADDPYGSLQLLTYLGFCHPDDAVYGNTLKWIHSEHNPHSGIGGTFAAPWSEGGRGPAIASVVNDLLTSRNGAGLDIVRRSALDDGIACAEVDADTGDAISGFACASCAGYLAYALRLATNGLPPETALVRQKRRPAETLYQPPPEDTFDFKKARP